MKLDWRFPPHGVNQPSCINCYLKFKSIFLVLNELKPLNLKTIYQNLKTKNLYEKSTNLFYFIILRCYPLDYMCKGTVFFETSQVFCGKSDRKRLIIDVNQQFVCEHTDYFTFVYFCFNSFHVSTRKINIWVLLMGNIAQGSAIVLWITLCAWSFNQCILISSTQKNRRRFPATTAL